MKRVLKSFGMEAGQMKKSKDDIWCGLSKFLSEIIEKYAENLEKDLKEKNGTSIITVRKVYKKYISIELLQKKRHIDIDYYVS